MKPLEHIKRLLDEMHRIQWHGHCKGNAAAWSAVSDIEIAIHKLRQVFEQTIDNNSKRKETKWNKRLKQLGRTIRRFLSAETGG